MATTARRYANGNPVRSPPPSLSVYLLAKRTPGMWSGLSILDEDGQLYAELQAYARAEDEDNEAKSPERGVKFGAEEFVQNRVAGHVDRPSDAADTQNGAGAGLTLQVGEAEDHP